MKANNRSKTTYAEILQQSGLRSTPARRAVLAWFEQIDRPKSHAEIVHALSPQGYDRVTLYRNLRELERAGLLQRIEVGDRCWRFERAAAHTICSRDHQHIHPHFICSDCGDVQCMPKIQIDMENLCKDKSLHMKRIEVNVHGLCQHCA